MITTQIDTIALAKELARELTAIIKPQRVPRIPSAFAQNNTELFRELRGHLAELGMDHKYFAEKLGMCPASFSGRMTGRLQWQMNEMYAVMDTLKIPYEQLSEYFPKNGKSVFAKPAPEKIARR